MLKRDLLCNFSVSKIDIRKMLKPTIKLFNKSKIQISPNPRKLNFLNNDICRKLLYELKHLVSVTETSFKLYYLDLLEQATLFLQQKKNTESKQISEDLFEKSFTRAINVLKYRRGYMLPIGADAETCYQQQDAWTLALFSSALLMDFGKESFQVVPAIVLERLKGFPDLYQQWEGLLNGEAGSNDLIAAIINKVNESTSSKSDTANQSNLLYPSSRLSNPEQAQDQTLNEAEKTEELNADDSLSEKFLAWLRKGLHSRKLSTNLKNSLVHRVPIGLLLVMPELWKKFISYMSDLKNGTYDLNNWQGLADDANFMRTESGDFVHGYCIGKWEDRRVLRGLVLKLQKASFPNPIPPINDQLTVDPFDKEVVDETSE